MTLYCSTFGAKSALLFAKNIQGWEIRIANNPQIGFVEPLLRSYPQEFRSIVVHKFCKIIYYIEGNVVHIADLWDSRREPKSFITNL